MARRDRAAGRGHGLAQNGTGGGGVFGGKGGGLFGLDLAGVAE